MRELFKIQGYWWLPEEPKYRVPGTLTFDPDDGATLELLGAFGDLEEFHLPLEPEIILGHSAKGEEVTLKSCFRTNNSINMTGFATSLFTASTVIIGEHFEKDEDVGFERLLVEYLYLDTWANDTGFEIEIVDDPDKRPLTVRHKLPDSLSAQADGYKVELDFGSTLKFSPPLVTEATITQSARLVIKFSEKQPLNDLIAISYNLQHFLSFGANCSVYPTVMWGATGPAKEVIPAEIHYRPTGSRVRNQKRPEYHNMRFMLTDLPGGFDASLGKWLDRSDLLGPVYRLYFGTIYNPNSFVEQQFLNIVQALEAYHRRAIGSSNLPEDEHERRLNSILDSAPKEYRKWLEGKFAYGNEPTLRKRLKELYKLDPENSKRAVGVSSKDRESFFNKVVDARNYRTHFDKSKEDKVPRGADLLPLTQKLKLLLEICLLREIGFEGEHLKEILDRNG